MGARQASRVFFLMIPRPPRSYPGRSSAASNVDKRQPLAAPSANPFGSISPTKPEHVARYFKNDIKMVLDGGSCANGIESTIIGFENDEPIIYRLGALPLEDIEAVVGKLVVKNNKEENPDAPGMLASYYSPKQSTYVVTDFLSEVKKHA